VLSVFSRTSLLVSLFVTKRKDTRGSVPIAPYKKKRSSFRALRWDWSDWLGLESLKVEPTDTTQSRASKASNYSHLSLSLEPTSFPRFLHLWERTLSSRCTKDSKLPSTFILYFKDSLRSPPIFHNLIPQTFVLLSCFFDFKARETWLRNESDPYPEVRTYPSHETRDW